MWLFILLMDSDEYKSISDGDSRTNERHYEGIILGGLLRGRAMIPLSMLLVEASLLAVMMVNQE